MTLPDVNVLIYAYRADTQHHEVCRRWLESVVEGPANFGMSRLALGAVVRICTNRKIAAPPEPPKDAFAFCRALLSRPNCIEIEPGANHWDIFERLCLDNEIAGPDVTDAWFAALAIEHGCEWITCDKRFARFPGLKWRLLA